MNNIFSPARVGSFLKKDLAESYRTILIVIGAVTGVLLVNVALNELPHLWNAGVHAAEMNGAPAGRAHDVYFSLILIIGGFIVSSRAFVEIHAKSRNHDWLMLPASMFEKYVVRLALTAVAWAIGTLVYYFLFSVVASGLVKVISGDFLPLFNPFTKQVWLLIANYVVLQSLFLFGSLYFKRSHFIKTVLVLTGQAILLGVIAAVVARILFGSVALQGGMENGDWSMIGEQMAGAGRVLWTIVQVAYWALLAPLFWSAGYIRLKETEVRNGV